MLKLTINDVQYTVHFSHGFEKGGKNPRRKTVCKLHTGECEGKPCTKATPAYIGESVCSRKDEFHGKVGEKIAFSRAIELFNREMRTAFWGASGLDREVTGGHQRA